MSVETAGKACPHCRLVMTHAEGCLVGRYGVRCRLCGLTGWHWIDCPMIEVERAQRAEELYLDERDRMVWTAAAFGVLMLVGLLVWLVAR